MSHYAWKSDRELLIHTSKESYGTKFNLYEDLTSNVKTIGKIVLSVSGHPSYPPDGAQLIVDTYPDATRRQRLLLCKNEGSFIKQLGNFYSPSRYAGDQKCDLHPRWDRSGSRICIDSAHSGYRAMYVISLK